ncbi:reverse transcriptase family protein [Oceanimonas baumannii]|uniref:RNA-directed DNA polymerase n=1 Tax=Oceanimonas baumannii TaxID=129578 RepID=A0A235CKC5_9GAMM|nr:reverse transcriptase family protein [Oceanimonas baumannii]OYD24886.1 reverse transcriptase [Oceanimonas baumannii]TDW59646.1 RNA-directed DNA polymerase [Oceanimonas baumannii]
MQKDKPYITTTNVISSIPNLCKSLNITEDELSQALSLGSDMYVRDRVEKSDGSYRVIHKPHYLLRKIQRRINKRIFQKLVGWPSYIFGSVPNTVNYKGEVVEPKDYVSCAAQHCGAKSLLKLDIKDFFDNIHIYHVERIFSGFFHYNEEVSKTLSQICTYNNVVVQGALTSSYIASLCLWDKELEVVERLKRKNLVYTRLVDDITVSSKVSNYQFDNASALIVEMLRSKDLPVNNNKTKVFHATIEPLMVHGMRVNFKEPRYPSDEVRRLRAAVRNVEMLASEPGYRTTFAYRKDFNRCMGRVSKLKRVKHEKHKHLVERLNKVLPLPSRTDLRRCKLSVRRLENDYNKKRESYWYKKRFYMVHDRLNVLQRTYFKTAYQLRERLKKIRPWYDHVENE